MATIALIFPGQGSQSPGMLKELAAAYPVVQRRFQEASDVLKLDLWQISQDETGSQIDQTAITQPALLAAGIACGRGDELCRSHPARPHARQNHAGSRCSRCGCDGCHSRLGR